MGYTDPLVKLQASIGRTITNAVISNATCPKCKGLMLGLSRTTVVECEECGKIYQRITDQDETYYVELIRAH